jgi:hypothetical protein
MDDCDDDDCEPWLWLLVLTGVGWSARDVLPLPLMFCLPL